MGHFTSTFLSDSKSKVCASLDGIGNMLLRGPRYAEYYHPKKTCTNVGKDVGLGAESSVKIATCSGSGVLEWSTALSTRVNADDW